MKIVCYLPALLVSSIVLLTVRCAPALAQTPKVVLTLDFAKPDAGLQATKGELKDLKKGDAYIVKINNINRMNYRILIAGKDTLRSSELKMPGYGVLGLSDLSSLAAMLPGLGIKSSVFANPPGEGLALLNIPAVPATPAGRAEGIMENYAGKLRQESGELTKQINAINEELATINQLVWESKLEAAPATAPDQKTLTNFLARVSSIQKRLADIEETAAYENGVYLAVIKAHGPAIQGSPALKENDERVKAAYQKLTEAITKVKAAITSEAIKSLTESLVAAINNSSRSYTSLPLQFSKEQTTLRIAIVPQNKDANLQSYSTSLVFPLSRQVFFGVSSGFFLSGLYNDAYSSYANQPTGSPAATYGLVQEQPGEYEFGVNALARVGYMFNPNDKVPVGLQLGFGPGLAVTNKVRPRAMLGGGLAFGSNQRLLLDYGVSFGYVDRLSRAYEGYSASKPYSVQPTEMTVSVIKHSWFVGIHYLFISF